MSTEEVIVPVHLEKDDNLMKEKEINEEEEPKTTGDNNNNSMIKEEKEEQQESTNNNNNNNDNNNNNEKDKDKDKEDIIIDNNITDNNNDNNIDNNMDEKDETNKKRDNEEITNGNNNNNSDDKKIEIENKDNSDENGGRKKKRRKRGGWDTVDPSSTTTTTTTIPSASAPPPTTPNLDSSTVQNLRSTIAMLNAKTAARHPPTPIPPVSIIPSSSTSHNNIIMTANNMTIPPPPPVVLPKPECRIYVGSLDYSITEPQVRELFEAFGKVNQVIMSMDPATGLSKGFCFIEYDTVECADLALNKMDGFLIAGRQIKVGRPKNNSGGPAAMTTPRPPTRPLGIGGPPHTSIYGPTGGVMTNNPVPVLSPEGTRIYVGSINFTIKTEIIQELFTCFGTVTGCAMLPDPYNPPHHKGYGFIEYDSRESAKTAIEGMNGFALQDRKMKVKWAATSTPFPTQGATIVPKASSGGDSSSIQPAVSSSAYGPGVVGGVPSPAQPAGITVPNPASMVNPDSSISKSNVILLRNVVGPEEANDPDLKEEITDEAMKYGDVSEVRIYPVMDGAGTVSEVKIFIVFATEEAAEIGHNGMNRRKFGGREIESRFYSLVEFEKSNLDW